MIKLMKNTFYKENEVKDRLCEFIKNSTKLSMSDKCKEFEEKFSEYQGRKYSVLFNSGSSANLALIQSLLNLGMLNRGDYVGFSCVTWSTNVMPLIQLGLNPVPVDISLENLNVTSEKLLERLKEKKLKALFLTNVLGFCGDISKIKEICDREGIILLEDNCESLGTIIDGKKLGNFGLASTASFFVGHHLSTIEGGMACTDDKEFYNMLKMVREHGWTRNLDEEARTQLKKESGADDFYERYTFHFPSYNIRPTEMTGFIGIEQLGYINEINDLRNKSFFMFKDAIKDNENIIQMDFDHIGFISNFAFPLVFKDSDSFNRFRGKFEKISEIRPIIGGDMTLQPFFKKYLKDSGEKGYSCPNSLIAHSRGFYFPNHPDMTEEEKESIVQILKSQD